MKVKTLLPLLFAALFTNLGARAQIIGSRLIGLTNTQYALSVFTPTDSTTYAYSGLHTSNMKTGVYQYDSSIYYSYDTAYHKSLKTYQAFDLNDSIFLINSFAWNDTTSHWDPYSTTNKTFGTNHLDSVNTQYIAISGVLQPAYEYEYKYNAANNLILQKRNQWNGAVYDSNEKYVYIYDSHNYLIVIGGYRWSITSSAYANYDEKDYTYDTTTGLVSMYTYKTWNPITLGWDISSIINYTYDASGKLSTAFYSLYNSTIGGVVPTSKDTLIYDGSGKLISIINASFDMSSTTFTNNKRTTWTYNSWDQPLVYMTESWDGSNWAPVNGQDVQTRYHYEEYTNAVNNIANKGGNLQVYPVPAQNYLNINLTWNTSHAFTVSIYDMQGRLMQQWNEGNTKNYIKTLPLAGIASGNYVLVIKGTEQQLVQQIVVNK